MRLAACQITCKFTRTMAEIDGQHLRTWRSTNSGGAWNFLFEVRLNLVHAPIGLKWKLPEDSWRAGGLEQKVEALAAAARMRAGAAGGAQVADTLAGLDPASLERVSAFRN